MSEFEEYVKARYPVDYESLKEKYPNFPICEFYGDEKDLWNFKQGEIDNLNEMNKRYIRKMQEQQDQIAELKTQLNNMEQCYIEMKKLVENLQKPIEEVCLSINLFFDVQVRTPSPREYCNFIAEIGQTLRGDHDSK